jgi:hypothetical protein
VPFDLCGLRCFAVFVEYKVVYSFSIQGIQNTDALVAGLNKETAWCPLQRRERVVLFAEKQIGVLES